MRTKPLSNHSNINAEERGLRSSLDSVFANGERECQARALSPDQFGRRLTLSFGGGVPPGRRGVNM